MEKNTPKTLGFQMPTSLAENLYPSVTDGKHHAAKYTKA